MIQICNRENPESIPIVDLAPYLNNQTKTRQAAEQLRNILKNVGFFYVKNHGLPKKIQEDMMKNMKQFFSLPRQEKQKIHMNGNNKSGMGYFGYKEQITSGKADLKEGIYVGQILQPNHPKVLQNFPLHGNNLLPDDPVGYSQCVAQYMRHMIRIGDLIMEAIAESLYLDKNYFKNGICKETGCYMSMLHYQKDQQNPQLVSLGQHNDYGFLVILMASDKGLEIRDLNGNWVNVNPIQDTLIINIGDVMQKMTQNLYRSTPHRVMKPLVADRYSVPFFYEPSWDCMIKEISFQFSQQQENIMKVHREQKRADNLKIQDLKGKYGKYFMQKMSSNFPVMKKYLHFYEKEASEQKII